MLSVTGGSETGFGVGEIKYAAKASINENWALCNGDVLLRSEYPELTQKMESAGKYAHFSQMSFSVEVPTTNGSVIVTQEHVKDIYYAEDSQEMMVLCSGVIKRTSASYYDRVIVLFYKTITDTSFEFDLENWGYHLISYTASVNYEFYRASVKKINGRYIVFAGKPYTSSSESTEGYLYVANDAASLAKVTTWTLTKLSGDGSQYGATFPIYADYVEINSTFYYVFVVQEYESDYFSVPSGYYHVYLISDIDTPSTLIRGYKNTYGSSIVTFGNFYMYNGNGYIVEISSSYTYWILRKITTFPTATGELSVAKTLQAASLSTFSESSLGNIGDAAYVTSFAYEGTDALYIFCTNYNSSGVYNIVAFKVDSEGNMTTTTLAQSVNYQMLAIKKINGAIRIFTTNETYTVSTEDELMDASKWVADGSTVLAPKGGFSDAFVMEGNDGIKIIPTNLQGYKNAAYLDIEKYLRLPTLSTDATISPYPQYFIKTK